jgi:hypothetical protein
MGDTVEPRSILELVGGIAQDAQDLVRGEIALARAELDRKLERVIVALIWTFGGMFVGFAGLIVILMAAVYALAYVIPTWAAALAIGVLIAVIGAGLSLTGIRMLTPANLAPHRLVRSIGRDARLVKEHV